ncbi:MAG: PEGA domain-containing protein [Methanoregulaceae archaeon]|jgi:hypothetical protein|nr:PEGA domain-containing protein [Methanoregulaceae archaeon]
MLIIAVPVSVVAAEDAVTPDCTEVDRFGNPICPVPLPADQNVLFRQDNNTEVTRYFTGITSTLGHAKDLYLIVQGISRELLEIAGMGIKRSINQTRQAGVQPGPGKREGGAGQDSLSGNESGFQEMKGQMMELSEIAGRGLKTSINLTLHADDYPSLTTPSTGIPNNTFSEDEEEGPPPNMLRTGYANLIKSILQFTEVTLRAFRGSFRNYSAENKSIWTNRSADDLIGSPLYGPVPEERFLLNPENLAARAARNVTPAPTLVQADNLTITEVLPVQPTPTPVPVPVFNLTVNSYPSGALIVLNGNRTGTTPFVMTDLEQKKYTLSLTRTGYLAYDEDLTLDEDKTLEIPLTSTMESLFVTPGKSTAQNRYGGMYVTSYPDKMDLTIDGVQVTGGTPFLYFGFTEGLHTVSLLRTGKASGPVTYSRNVWVYRDALTIFNIDTEEVLMSKRVTINPGPYSSAEFTINGRYPVGRLPATISAGCPGSFIGVRKGEAYTSFLIPCTNQPTVSMNLVEPQEPHPPLLVSSVPEGAEIFIDGFRTGYATPHTFTEISGSLHRIMLSKPGLYPVEKIVTLEIRDSNTTSQKVLFPMENYGEGTIVIDSLPKGASIYLNGWTPGESTPHTFDHMKLGFYEVIVQMGSKQWIEQFELTPSKVCKVVADFKI